MVNGQLQRIFLGMLYKNRFQTLVGFINMLQTFYELNTILIIECSVDKTGKPIQITL